MLFAIGFIFTFINGGLTGLFLGNVVVDLPLSDTYFVVAHFHMVMGVSPVLVVCGAIYHWYPKLTGRMLNDTLGKVHFWLTFIGTYVIYLPDVLPGHSRLAAPLLLQRRDGVHSGVGRLRECRYHDGCPGRRLAQLLFVINLITSLRFGKKADPNPWRATTLEWQTPQTPPDHGNWGPELPQVYRWAYDYSVPGAAEDFTPQNEPPPGQAA